MTSDVHFTKHRMVDGERPVADDAEDFDVSRSEFGGLVEVRLASDLFPDFRGGQVRFLVERDTVHRIIWVI